MYEGYHLLGYYLYTAITNTTLFNYVQPEKAISSMSIPGPFGEIFINSNGQRIAGYDVLVVDKSLNSNNFIMPLGTISTDKKCPDQACLNFVLNSTSSFEPLKDVPLCGFHGEICDQTGVIIAIAVIMGVLLMFIIILTTIRKCCNGSKGRSISNPWVIPFQDVRFIDLTNTEGSQHMSIQSLQRNMEEKQRLQSLARTKHIATVDQVYVLADKYVMRDKLRYDKIDINLLYQMKSHLQHDNLNSFVGITIDKASHMYIIWNQCFRGSLHDHIFTKERQRGTATRFEGLFLRDILKGLEYIHASAIDFHGNLTLHNCMLDSHWIVKLSGFGVNRLLVKWKTSGQIFTEDHTPVIKSEELHYFDPAMKKIWKNYADRNERALITPQFGKKCDMYSFGVILHEIILKKKFVEQLFDSPREEDDSVLIDDENDAIASRFPLPIIIPEGIEMHNDLIKMLENCFGSVRPDIALARKIIDTVLKMSGSLVDLMIKNLTAYTQGLNETVKNRTAELEKEQEKGDQLLMELLPKSVANDLKNGIAVDPKVYENATILYSDIVGFTSLCSQSQPMEVVTLLSGMYQRFDLIISQQGGYKMETIGDAYCVAAGLPVVMEKDHVKSICMIALLQRDCLHHFEIPHRPGTFLNCRWGFNSGPVFAGVIGQKAPRYACFGEAVILASKMESSGVEDRIQMTLASQQLLEENFPQFVCSNRGGRTIEGIGRILTYWLEGVNAGEQVKVVEFQNDLNDELSRIMKKDGELLAAATALKPKDKMTLAKEKVIAERKNEEERLQRQQTLQEALEEHEEEIEMNEVLVDEDEGEGKPKEVDLTSIVSTQMEELEDEPAGRTIGHGRLDSQASTIPDN
ncbi:guanylate cyclase [Caenorhabditis elegans]|nr:guanylate cyclase [Caenorhabditis elegans]CTQ86710.1 guanylate cyclase [Caenorhabditis elegans]|eukprot:NP_001300011.1 Receptor-type guanylate cyclase daf-11 [Caenorhabditis elegans]